MSLFEDTNPRALKELLGEIHSGMTVLPDFQRDFVWDPGATQELVVSIANNYPAGSLLRVRDKHSYFACREFEGAPQIDGKKHTFLVLDGQQRLTSLYQAFYGVGEHRYYLNLKSLIEGKDFDEGIDDHHVFPSDFLEKKKGVPARMRDCVLNRTLIDRTTNQLISNRPPSDYMKEIQGTKGFPFQEVLDSHRLPPGGDSPFWADDFEAFLKWRETALWEDIKTVTGVKVASDLVAEGADSA